MISGDVTAESGVVISDGNVFRDWETFVPFIDGDEEGELGLDFELFEEFGGLEWRDRK